MMFNCTTHGWTSFEKPCLVCIPVTAFPSNTNVAENDTSWSELHEQIEFLKAENARYREALEMAYSRSHEVHCDWFNPNDDKCNCILTKINKALKGE